MTNASLTGSNPFDAYIVMGSRIKRSWLDATDPSCRSMSIAPMSGPVAGKVKITLHQRSNSAVPVSPLTS